MNARIGDIKDAFSATLALEAPITDLAGRSVTTIQALGDIGASGASCFASSFALALKASASIKVSVSASASVQGKAG
jgi:hypothetical protein